MTERPPSGGLYIHIPFCHARCGYCDFVTFTGKEDRIDQYVTLLQRELDLLFDSSNPLTLHTVFFGGGTPSLLNASQIDQILQHARRRFMILPNAEITLEANPESLTAEKARGWRKAGVNRLSIGLQAMDDTLLKAMDRLHSVAEFQAAYNVAREAGFDNINIDLIYGFPAQTMPAWQDTVRKTIVLQPEHVSMYALAVEEHTPFAAQQIKVDADVQGDMYAWARQTMAKAGYLQYEISNFARAGRECKHNLIYWRQQDYVAIGTGAVGCVGRQRWTNHKSLHAYAQDLAAGRLPRLSVETVSEQDYRFERLMLGLRLREGLEWGNDVNPRWVDARNDLAQQGHLEEIHPGRWRVTDASVAFTNKVLLPFLD